ncbi:MAG: SEC-C domain-containing protein, partial [Candidatus Omnitrophica bacterium]|nr:SEC-C domain-containing protein [Candidatus Omnitrophota bacterium]
PPPPMTERGPEGPNGSGRPAPKGPLVKSSPLGGKRAGPAPIDKIGRNDPCYCGSGKKYKKCHGT